jgi:hypothetical protein
VTQQINSIIPVERIQQSIYYLRGEKVMLSTDLAGLYGIEPRVLIQAVKRNSERFPEDFMFQLSEKEFENLKSQIVTSSWGGMRRARPYAFTEQGVAMLSSVLRSKQAVEFIALPLLRGSTPKGGGGNNIAMIAEDQKPKSPIGYHTEIKGRKKKTPKAKKR